MERCLLTAGGISFRRKLRDDRKDSELIGYHRMLTDEGNMLVVLFDISDYPSL